ncbi:MAG: ACP S-malonyltransferase [Chitinivibrionales bacterium]|nr:ACP S-malonyltransferase [Chitinivibrionales bacterium]
MKYAFLFPGQGSQKVGMGADLIDKFEQARRRFDEADALLGKKLSALILNGPLEELTLTSNTQPALFTLEAIITDILASKGIVPALTAGHSLGEYGALYAAGVISFADGLALVARRGALMAVAGEKNPGTMAAIIGLPRDKIAEICAGITDGIVACANENSPDQTVISGSVAAVKAACEACKTAGAKRALPLNVSGAFHSPLMQPVADQFKEFLEPFAFKTPAVPVIANVSGATETDAAKLKSNLIAQLISPVRWENSMQTLASASLDKILEVGPGNVLCGLAKRCNESLNVVPCGTAENIFSL